MKLWMLLVPMALGITACVSVDDNSIDPADMKDELADYTIMFYSVGGGNLDASQEQDWLKAVSALTEAGQTVRMMIQFKYSSKEDLERTAPGYLYSGQAGQTYRFELTPELANELDPEAETMDVSLFNIVDKAYGTQGADAQLYQPDSLSNYIKYCQQTAPARNYILVISDHGGAYSIDSDFDKSLRETATTRGFIQDNTVGGDLMSCKELRTALERSGLHPKMVYFDCCLMNSIETLSELIGLTDYVLAGGHTILGGNHERFVELLSQAATTGNFEDAMKQYAEAIVERHRNDIAESDDPQIVDVAKYVDFVLTDMSKVPAIYEPLRQFVSYVVSHYDESKTELYAFAANNCYQYYNEGANYDLMDYCMILDAALFSTVDADGNVTLEEKPTEYLHQFYSAVEQAQLCHYYTSDINKDYDLTYSVTLGANLLGQGGVRRTLPTGDGGKAYCYTMEDGRQLQQIVGGDGSLYDGGFMSWLSWDNTYRKLEFDRRTGWSEWMRLNPAFPKGNPPTDDENDHLR